jgi:hypothetical protein
MGEYLSEYYPPCTMYGDGSQMRGMPGQSLWAALQGNFMLLPLRWENRGKRSVIWFNREEIRNPKRFAFGLPM